MSSLTQNGPGSKLTSGCALFGLLWIAVVLVVVAHEVIDVIDEGIMHEMARFESEPKEGWDYWRWKVIREALPSWIVAGGIWLSIFGFVLWRAWKRATHIFN